MIAETDGTIRGVFVVRLLFLSLLFGLRHHCHQQMDASENFFSSSSMLLQSLASRSKLLHTCLSSNSSIPTVVSNPLPTIYSMVCPPFVIFTEYELSSLKQTENILYI